MSKDIKERIEHALSEIQPYLEADKGGVEVVDYSNHVLKIRFTGTCKTCDMQHYTFKAAIEENIKNRIPEIRSIEIIQ